MKLLENVEADRKKKADDGRPLTSLQHQLAA
jgi:hypothetical protein